jgi:putative glutamine amidotransferase
MAGGVPILLPAARTRSEVGELLARIDALLLVGGDDIDPQRYGERPHPRTEVMHPKREAADFALFELADRVGLPIMGICLGSQVINVARGGTLHQHIPDLPNYRSRHKGEWPDRGGHDVRIEPRTRLRKIIGRPALPVNSAHHQGIRAVGKRLKIAAWSDDGFIEAVEDVRPDRFLLGIGWHPEEISDRPEQLRLFRALVRAAVRK